MKNKTKLLLTILLFFACPIVNKVKAQSYIMPNANWCYFYSSFNQFSYIQFSYIADTAINNYPTKIISENRRDYYYDDNMIVHLSNSSFFKKHYFRESNDTVWSYVNGQFYIQFVFNAVPGDIWPTNDWTNHLTPCNNTYTIVLDTVSITFNNQLLKGLKIRKVACESGWPWPEGTETVYYKKGPQTALFAPSEWFYLDSTVTFCAAEDLISYHDINNPMSDEGTNYCRFTAVGVDENEVFSFNLVYPNPSNSLATFEYSLKNKANITFNVYDHSGKLIKSMYRGNQPNGVYRELIDVATYPPGIYMLQVITGSTTLNKTLVIEH